jgi:hypothetical protein
MLSELTADDLGGDGAADISRVLIEQEAILSPFSRVLRVAKVAKDRSTTEDRSITACRHAA